MKNKSYAKAGIQLKTHVPWKESVQSKYPKSPKIEEWREHRKHILIAIPISSLIEEYKKAIYGSSCSGNNEVTGIRLTLPQVKIMNSEENISNDCLPKQAGMEQIHWPLLKKWTILGDIYV